MSKGLALKDFYDLIAINANISSKTAEKVWNEILNIIISEIQYNDRITINNFGRFDKIFKGGKDEFLTNELGVVEKRYVDPITSVEFTPSVNFVKKFNEEIIDKLDKVESIDRFFDYGNVLIEEDVELKISDQISKALERKKKRREKERVREKELYVPQRNGDIPKSGIDIFRGKPIKCITTNKAYPSMTKCAKELNLRTNNIRKALDTGEDVYGYKFVELTPEEFLKEQAELEIMKQRNKNAE